MTPISLNSVHVSATMSQKARETGSLSLVKMGNGAPKIYLSYLGRSVRSFISSVATNFRADDIYDNILLNQYIVRNTLWANCIYLKNEAGDSQN